MEDILKDLVKESIATGNRDKNVITFISTYAGKYDFVDEFLETLDEVLKFHKEEYSIKSEGKKSWYEKFSNDDDFGIFWGIQLVFLEGLMYKGIEEFITKGFSEKSQEATIMFFIIINIVLVVRYFFRRKDKLKLAEIELRDKFN